jgi:ribokinase
MIVCFGSINLDLVFPLPALPLAGQTVLGRAMQTEPGGKGANQAVAAARDGAAVAFVGAVGRDAFAGAALATMRGAGVDLTRVAETDTSTGCAAICVDPAGRNQIAVASGANLLVRAAQVESRLLGRNTTLLLQGEVDLDETATLIRRARAASARIVLNLAPAGPLARGALEAVDVLVLNEDEAAWLAAHLGVAPEPGALHTALHVDVVVTLGEHGLVAVTRKGAMSLPAEPITPVDTTGAGDCFTGVLAGCLDRDEGFPDALRRANMAAALCCTRAGSQGSMPYSAETDTALAG